MKIPSLSSYTSTVAQRSHAKKLSADNMNLSLLVTLAVHVCIVSQVECLEKTTDCFTEVRDLIQERCHNRPPGKSPEDSCCRLQKLLYCSELVVHDSCGQEGVQVYKAIVKNIINQSFMSELDCESSDCRSAAISTKSAPGAIASLLIVLAWTPLR